MNEQDLQMIESMITQRLVEFHKALVERGQIPLPPPQYGTTVDYTEDAERPVNRPQ